MEGVVTESCAMSTLKVFSIVPMAGAVPLVACLVSVIRIGRRVEVSFYAYFA